MSDNNCFFCTNNIKIVDFQDVETLKRFLDSQAKIMAAKKSGTCAKHQRKITKAIKRARIMGLLPFVSR